MTNITMIVAMDKNRVIGKAGDVPWRGKLKADAEHFRNTTLNKIVVMGRKTYNSLPEKYKPLPKRENLVMTRDLKFNAPGCAEIRDAGAIIRMSEYREVFVIGGKDIYGLFLPVAQRLIVTHVETEVVGGDTLFPKLSPQEWVSNFLFRHEVDEKNDFPFHVVEYTRR